MPEMILKLGDDVIEKYSFDKDIVSIGRARDNDVVVENLSVSRNHARIRRQGGKFILTDLNSANGTMVNGVRVTKTEIVDSDVIFIGKHRIEFINRVEEEDELITQAIGGDRTMIVTVTPVGILSIIDNKMKGQEFHLTKFETTIGKAASNDIVIGDDWFLSKKQAIITRRDNRFEIRDLGGFRKTRVNGATVSDPMELKPGDIIEFGNTRCMFQVGKKQAELPAGARVPEEMGLDDSMDMGYREFHKQMAERQASPPPPSPAPTPTGAIITKDITPGHVSATSTDMTPQPADEEFRDDEDNNKVLSFKEMQAILAAEGADSATDEAAGGVDEEELESSTEGDAEEDLLEAAAATQPSPAAAGEKGGSQKAARRRNKRDKHRKDRGGTSAAPEAPRPTDDAPQAAEQHDESSMENLSEASAKVENRGEPQIKESDPSIEQHPSMTVEKEIRLWEAALENRSAAIRKQAAARLKKLTGKDYAN